MGEWLSKLWYIHDMEYDSATPKNELPIEATAWVDLKGVTLSGKSQSREIMYRVIPFIEHSWKNKTRDGEQICGCQGDRDRNGAMG